MFCFIWVVPQTKTGKLYKDKINPYEVGKICRRKLIRQFNKFFKVKIYYIKLTFTLFLPKIFKSKSPLKKLYQDQIFYQKTAQAVCRDQKMYNKRFFFSKN